jgi:hypothetical protein
MEMGQTIARNDPHTVKLIRKIMVENIGSGWREMMLNEIQNISESLKPPPPKESFKEFLNRKSQDKS